MIKHIRVVDYLEKVKIFQLITTSYHIHRVHIGMSLTQAIAVLLKAAVEGFLIVAGQAVAGAVEGATGDFFDSEIGIKHEMGDHLVTIGFLEFLPTKTGEGEEQTREVFGKQAFLSTIVEEGDATVSHATQKFVEQMDARRIFITLYGDVDFVALTVVLSTMGERGDD